MLHAFLRQKNLLHFGCDWHDVIVRLGLAARWRNDRRVGAGGWAEVLQQRQAVFATKVHKLYLLHSGWEVNAYKRTKWQLKIAELWTSVCRTFAFRVNAAMCPVQIIVQGLRDIFSSIRHLLDFNDSSGKLEQRGRFEDHVLDEAHDERVVAQTELHQIPQFDNLRW